MILPTLDVIIHKYLRVPYPLHVTKFRSPKRPKATIVLIHGIGNSAQAWSDVADLLPEDVRVIGVDLLGFGESPKPYWAQYSASTQAKSLGVTLLKLGLNQKVTLVGHSLGSLVAVETAKRYSPIVKQLILCSPPFYHPNNDDALAYEKILRTIYKTAIKYPSELISLSPMAVRLGIVNKSMSITDTNVGAYTAALAASIINQTSLHDVANLKAPIRILYGSLDPVVIGKHIDRLSKEHANISAKKLLAGHEITGKYTKVTAEEIIKSI